MMSWKQEIKKRDDWFPFKESKTEESLVSKKELEKEVKLEMELESTPVSFNYVQ